ncbi:FmdB family zinc ribbon protein [Paenibacillus apiarius]|uniref:Uncharacterized protein n=1 Tax=Paenibacillus apiarius TaxID=46240 RepID=A0ABT4DZ48_9BACL|nr:hypothetical protein [Paenibacillus apiarius]MCY9513288.1 hypothetical protein [Paenibacillus apiarius]MCY9521353.1 hypothetical protein [Paenibacillus apiarius]MCY9554500.1 hypothetical protein [Paenibacillus apiarius]MCY9560704.1 hypothetical protein [Paenibacillus apiarius]MCY9685045.1 hypothetical protein [Paenibacillus apiarius]
MWQLRIYDRKHFWDDNYHLMELVKEVPEEPSTECIYEIDGKTYRWCAISPENKVIGIKEISINSDPEEESDYEFKCPYCGSIYHDAWELPSDEDKIECGNCGSEIEYERNIEITYTVTPVKIATIVTL